MIDNEKNTFNFFSKKFVLKRKNYKFFFKCMLMWHTSQYLISFSFTFCFYPLSHSNRLFCVIIVIATSAAAFPFSWFFVFFDTFHLLKNYSILLRLHQLSFIKESLLPFSLFVALRLLSPVISSLLHLPWDILRAVLISIVLFVDTVPRHIVWQTW